MIRSQNGDEGWQIFFDPLEGTAIAYGVQFAIISTMLASAGRRQNKQKGDSMGRFAKVSEEKLQELLTDAETIVKENEEVLMGEEVTDWWKNSLQEIRDELQSRQSK